MRRGSRGKSYRDVAGTPEDGDRCQRTRVTWRSARTGSASLGTKLSLAREALAERGPCYRTINAMPCRTLRQSDRVMLSEPTYAALRVNIVGWTSPCQALT